MGKIKKSAIDTQEVDETKMVVTKKEYNYIVKRMREAEANCQEEHEWREKLGRLYKEAKHSATSYKSRNTLQRKEIERLKRLNREGDELNEQRIKEIEEQKKKIDELADEIVKLQCENQSIENEYERYKALPWYKRIF